MATITKRAPRQWQVKIRRRGYRTQSKTFQTKAAAEQWSRQIESEMDRSVFVSLDEAESTTLEMLSARYCREVLPDKKAIVDVNSRIKTLNKHLGHITLAGLDARTLKEYRSYRLQKVSSESVRKELSLLRRLIKYGQQELDICLPRGNPVDSIAMPAKAKSRDRRLEGHEESLLLQHASKYGGEIFPIVGLAIETAMRRSEVANLKWENINFKTRTAKLIDTKNGEDREIPLSQRAVEILQSLPRNFNGSVFEMREDSITQAFTRVRRSAALHDLRFHDLRHEATSRLFELGLGLMEVAAITGHKDLAMLKRYTHLRAADLAKKLG
ncbi:MULTISPECIES: site-specific integrase [Gammaproteobacteria]|uniref:site-specific integrase n=1 Tax=Gammaproteobacteria TaxID=1236 RepID=UPI003265AD25